MPSYPFPLNQVVAAVTREAQANIVDYNGKGEWLSVKPRFGELPDVYGRLERRWNVIVGSHASRFALLYVAGGPESGIWIHYFTTDKIASEYAPGCHSLPSWA